MSLAECPNRSTLFDYLVGKLPEEASDSLSTHVESCPDCQAELATLSDIEDTLIGQLRGAVTSEPYLDESECGRAIAKAKGVTEGEKGDSPRSPESQTSLPTHLGEYRLIERLGSGGMGAVYKAVHNRLDRTVALKILPRARTDDQRAIVRFEREMKAIGRLDHPHIVRAYDAREIDDRLVLVMEFVEGLDLGKIVRRLGQIAAADACELARQAALGLQVAHEHGMVHRDVKPSNLMLTPEGQVKLLDLGLARLQGGLSQFSSVGTAVELPSRPSPEADEDMTSTGQAMGTADYMAPEQTSDSRSVDIRADIYSLGATLYKLLSGRAPFSGPEYESAFDKMLAHRQTPPPPIEQFCPSIPDGLAAVLNRMLAKDPAARYQTPSEAAEALAPFCAGADLPALLQRAEASNVSPLPPGEGQGEGVVSPNPLPTPRRWRTIAAVVVALLLVGGLGFGLGIIIHIRNQNGEEATLNVPNRSDVKINNRGEATVTAPGAVPKEKTPQNADLQFEIAKVAAELAAQRALLKNVDEAGLSPVEVDQLVQSDPVAKQLSAELGWKKMDQTYNEGSVKKGAKNPYANRQSEQVDRLQKQYDERVKEIETKIRQKKRSLIQSEIVRLQAILESLQQPQVGRQEAAAPAATDAKAIQGTWEIVSSTFSLAARLPGEGNLLLEQLQKTTKIVITADTFRVMGGHIVNRVFEYQLNPDAKPKIIDLQDDGGVYLGIYQLSGNELKICAASRSSDATPRPTEFWAEFGADKELLVLRRVGNAVVSNDDKAIQGKWRVESTTAVGLLFSRDQPIVISSHDIQFMPYPIGDKQSMVQPHVPAATYALDPTSQPKAIDLSGTSGLCSGIYRLQDDRLTLCLRTEMQGGELDNGSARPRTFAANEKTQAYLVVLKHMAEPAAAADAKAIQGTWEIVSSTFKLIQPLDRGENVTPEQVRQTTRVIITADSFKVIGDHVVNQDFVYQLKLDATPKMIDLAGGGGASLGIFQSTGNELKICASPLGSERGQERPSEFWAELGSGKELLVLRRVGDAVVSDDEKAILGTWRVETPPVHALGVPFPDSQLFADEKQEVVISAHTMKFLPSAESNGSRSGMRGGQRGHRDTEESYALDPNSRPKIIDLTCWWRVPMLAIYELQGDRLTICCQPGSWQRSARPTKLAADEKTHTAMVVLKRVTSPDHATAAGPKPIPSEAAAALDSLKNTFHAVREAYKKGDAALLEANVTNVTREIEAVQSLLDGTAAEKPWAEQAELLRAYAKAAFEHNENRMQGFEPAFREWDIGAKGRAFHKLIPPAGQSASPLETKDRASAMAKSPSTAALQFGPVIERTVNDANESDKNNAVNLTSGKLIDLPADFLEEWPVEKQPQWCAEHDVDLLCFLAKNGACLMPQGLKLAALMNEQWDNPTEAQIRAALASATPGKATSSAGSLTTVAEVAEAGGMTIFKIHDLPATFAFETRKNELGILQVLRLAENPFGVRIRYKLAQPSAANAAATPVVNPLRANVPQAPNANQTLPTFGPVIERVANARSEGTGKNAIDLANDKVVDLPKDFCQQAAEKQRQWCEQNNVDLLFDDGAKDKNPSLVPEGLMLALLDDEQWIGVSENVLRSALTSDTPEMSRSDVSAPFYSSVVVKERGGIVFWTLQQRPPPPLTFAFQTRKGALGIMQVLRFTEEPHGVRIRYKLVQPPAEKAPGPPAVNAVAEYRALLGQWKVVRVEKGNDADSDWAKILGYTDSAINPATASRFRFDERELHILSFETAQTWQFGFRFDPFTRIKQLDLTKLPDNAQLGYGQDAYGTAGLGALGIYEIKDGRLKIRLARVMPALNFDQRPSSFAVAPDSGDILFTLERLRPSKDEQALERSGGRWAVTSQTEGGKPVGDGERTHREWTFADNSFVSLICGKDANGVQNSAFSPSGLYCLNTDKQPKQITLFASAAGKVQRQDLLGIYKFEGERLTIAYCAYCRGGKPPEKFESQPGSGVALLVLERAKPAAAATPAATGPMPVVMPAVPEVSLCRPVLRDVTDYRDFTGHTEASQTVEVRSRVSGDLVKVLFKAGANVKQGDVLFEIDPRQYQAELDKRTADLSAAQTRAQHAAAELQRAKTLAKSRAISTSDLDRVESEQKETRAAVLAAEADLKLAKLNLDDTKICAAISGAIGRPTLTAGSLVTAGTQTLATIVSSDPMCVVFDVDERTVLDLRRRAAEEKAKTGRELPIEVRFGLPDEKDCPHHCTIESKDERIDPAVGVAHWRATLPNPDGLLMPGMFARVRLLIGSPRQALLIPEEVLAFDQGRRFVFVVGEKNTVERRDVEIGQSDGDLRVVKAGLTADDRVVVFPQKVQAGMIVTPKPGTREMPPPKSGRAAVSRDDTAPTVIATGTIEPEELVDVGSAVAGQVISLGLGSDGKPIDYMSPVNQGTILASIDPTVYKARVDQEEAALRRAQAEVALAEAKGKSQTPEVARASLQAAKATLLQCESALALAKRNLDCTTIRSPVKGVIIDRRVNAGQNVNPAGANAPSLFLIAKDLKKMQVWAQVNEADVPRIRKGMAATFTVAAFPNQTFHGAVSQIRLNAAMTQNVVTYTVIISFDNPDLKLMPYLTATVQFQVDPRKSASCAPAAAMSNQSPPAFGPPREVTLNAIGEGNGGEAIDFREDRPVDMPKEASQWTHSEKCHWMTLHNVDLAFDYTSQFSGGQDKRRILAFDNSGWRWKNIAGSRLATATSDEIREELWREQPVSNLLFDPPTEDRGKTLAFGFITGKGDVGVMQVVGRKENPGSVTIRYRIAKKPRSPHLEGDLYSRYGTAIVKLPQGSVELVAITADLEPPFRLDHVWWTTDGKPADLVPLRPLNGLWPLSKRGRVRTFLFRFKDLPADASTIWSTADCTGEQWIDPVCYADGIVDPELKMVRAAMPDAKAATLRIRVDACRWETGAVWKPDGHGKATFTRDGESFWVEYEKAAVAKNEPGSTQIGLRHAFRWEWKTRLVAVGKDGREKAVEPSQQEVEVTYRFDEMPLSSIKEFRFEVRRYYPANFYNVALNPQSAPATDAKNSGEAGTRTRPSPPAASTIIRNKVVSPPNPPAAP